MAQKRGKDSVNFVNRAGSPKFQGKRSAHLVMQENSVIPLVGPYASNAFLAIFLEKMLHLAKCAP